MNVRRKNIIKETKIVFNEEIIQQNISRKKNLINTPQKNFEQINPLNNEILQNQKNPNYIYNKLIKSAVSKNHHRSKSEIMSNEKNIKTPRKIKTCIIDFKKIFQKQNIEIENPKTIEIDYDKNTKSSELSYPSTAYSNKYSRRNYSVEQVNKNMFSSCDLSQVKNKHNKNVSDFSNKSSLDDGNDSFRSDFYSTYTKTKREIRFNRSVNVYRKSKCLDKYKNNGLSLDKKSKSKKLLNNSSDRIKKITINLNNINPSRNLKFKLKKDKINNNLFNEYMQINNRLNNFNNYNNYLGSKRINNIMEYDLCIMSNTKKTSNCNNHNNYLIKSNNFANNNTKNNIYFDNNNQKENISFYINENKNNKSINNYFEKNGYESNLNSTNEKTISENNKINFRKIFSPKNNIQKFCNVKEFYKNPSKIMSNNSKKNKQINCTTNNIANKTKEDNLMNNLKKKNLIKNIPLKLNNSLSQKKYSNLSKNKNKKGMNKKDLVANIIVINNNEYHLWNEFSRLYNKAK